MNEDTIQCPYCGSSIPNGSIECPECGKKIEKKDSKILNALTSISGVGTSRAKNIVRSGFSEIDDLEEIDVEGLESIEGIGESTAEDIVEEIEETKDEEGNLYLCDACGAFVSEDSASCPNCGATMEVSEEESKEENIEEREENRYQEDEAENLTEEEEEDGSLYLCENCGSFVGAETEVCPTCGAKMTEEREEDIDKESEGPSVSEVKEEEQDFEEDTELSEEDEESGLFLCDSCGAFVDSSSEVCPSCGSRFDDGEPIEEEIIEEETIEEPTKTEEKIEKDDEVGGLEEEIIKEEMIEEGEIQGEIGEEIEDELTEEEIDEILSLDEEEFEDTEEMKVSKTVDPVLLGEERKMCSNCGYISEKDAEECPICGRIFGEEGAPGEEEEMKIKGPEPSMDEQEETLKSVFGIENIPESAKEDIKEGEENDFDYCTVCGAFIADGEDRCPVCGSLKSEMEEQELGDEEIEEGFEDIYRPTDRGEDLSICEVCGAFIGEEQKSCPICGSDLERARSKVDEYEKGEFVEKDREEEINDFFGDAQGIDFEENEDSTELYLCNSCGAMLSKDADICPICGADVGEDGQELDSAEEAHDLFLEERESVDEVKDTSKPLDGEIEEEETIGEIDDLNHEIETIEEGKEKETIKETPIDKEEMEDKDDISQYLEEESGTTEEELVSLLDELEEETIDTVPEDIDTSDEEIQVQETGESISVEGDTDQFNHDEIESILNEIEKDIDSKGESETTEEITESSEQEEEWKTCPVCDSHIDIDSEYCTVCDTSLKDHSSGFRDEKIKMEEGGELEVGISDIQDTSKEIDEKSSISTKVKDIEKKPKEKSIKRKPNSFSTSSKDSQIKAFPSKVEDMMAKAKNYEVPVSSLSLLAFGGVYLSTYGNSNFPYFAEVSLVLLGIFFGLGFFTFFILKEDFLSDSKMALSGYLLGIVLSGFVPIQCYILGWRLPIHVNVILVSLALGFFWIFDFELPENHSFLLWFAGISILLIVSLILGFGSINLKLTNFDYSLLLPMGLGSTLLVGSTISWYRQAKQKETIAENHIPDAQQSLKMLNYGNMDDMKEEVNDLSVSCYGKGIACVQMGDHKGAIKNFKKALEEKGEDHRIWCNLGAVYSRVGNQKKAKEALKRGLNIEEGYELAWNNLGNAHYRAGDYEEALKCYEKAIKINDSYRDARANKSQVLIKLGDY